jgi:hypothetical protein
MSSNVQENTYTYVFLTCWKSLDMNVILGEYSIWLALQNSYFWGSSQISILARSKPHSELQVFKNWKVVSYKKCWIIAGK